MTKLMCPIQGCHKSDFIHQSHVLDHLRKEHGIHDAYAEERYYRNLQDEVWQERHDAFLAKWKKMNKRSRKAFNAFAEDPGNSDNELAGEAISERLKAEMVEVMEVVDDPGGEEDEDEDEEDGNEGGEGAEAGAGEAGHEKRGWFGCGPGYNGSDRWFQGGRARAAVGGLLDNLSAPQPQSTSTSTRVASESSETSLSPPSVGSNPRAKYYRLSQAGGIEEVAAYDDGYDDLMT